MSTFINATIENHQLDALFEVMKDHSIHLKPVLAAIGNVAVKSIKRNFREGGRPNKWAESQKPKGKTMIGTGHLSKHIHYSVDNDESGVTIATPPVKYAAILHFGGKTRPHEIWYKNRRALRFVFLGFKKSPYKMSFAKIPYFMRVCKRFGVEKIRKIQ